MSKVKFKLRRSYYYALLAGTGQQAQEKLNRHQSGIVKRILLSVNNYFTQHGFNGIYRGLESNDPFDNYMSIRWLSILNEQGIPVHLFISEQLARIN